MKSFKKKNLTNVTQPKQTPPCVLKIYAPLFFENCKEFCNSDATAGKSKS